MNEDKKVNSTRTQKNSRRKFLKKVVYVTPSLIILGQLTKPVQANAACVGSDCTEGPVW